ncbi:AAA family ATPase [Nocardia camponoti]|uniref:Nuclease SbcCD subunit C n=1 Tax=Nocardia camponoti TaxID=1616106 RepID=A0A917QER0_9NOCA|nr:AAA family ATPase [Nocardia camponoti]GGK47929.1 hypothetical protein GCM10011591_19090 [Nocardia camponoti]
MKLHRLEMTAFGPFAAPTVIDFDALGADGLFLLHGQTGAGKTTVLDAIAFALYGRVPGARNESRRLHSDHADVDTVPRVVVEATLGGRRLRLTRSPAHTRPSSRDATKLREIQAKGTLEWLDGSGENLSRLTDIGEEILRLLGMSADQFFQVVLLPQGDFARFLRADNEERETLLEKLFDTQRFASAEVWLSEHRKAVQRKLEESVQGINRLITKVGMAGGFGGAESVAEQDPVGWSQELLGTAREELAASSLEVEARQQESKVTRSEAEEARRVADLHARMRAATADLVEYEAGANQRAALRVELEQARRAEPVAHAIDEARTAVVALRRASSATEGAAGQLAKLLCAPGATEVVGVAEVLREAVDDEASVEAEVVARGLIAHPELDSVLNAVLGQWNSFVGVLGEANADAQTAQRVANERAAAEAEVGKLSARMSAVAARQEALPAALASAEEQLREATDASAALSGLRNELTRLQGAAAAAVELSRARSSLDREQDAFAAARSKYLDARERVQDLRERRLAGMAAELAAGLVDATPCSVCGSAQHPQPAQPTEDAVSKEEEAAAAKVEQAAERTRDTIAERIGLLEREIEALVARGGDADPVSLAASVRTATAQFEDADEAARRVPAATATVDRLRAEEAQLSDQARELATQHSHATTTIAAAVNRLAELTERLREVAGSDGTVAARTARVSALIEMANATRAARQTEVTARDAVRQITTRVERLADAASIGPAVAGHRTDTAAGSGTGQPVAAESHASAAAVAGRLTDTAADSGTPEPAAAEDGADPGAAVAGRVTDTVAGSGTGQAAAAEDGTGAAAVAPRVTDTAAGSGAGQPAAAEGVAGAAAVDAAGRLTDAAALAATGAAHGGDGADGAADDRAAAGGSSGNLADAAARSRGDRAGSHVSPEHGTETSAPAVTATSQPGHQQDSRANPVVDRDEVAILTSYAQAVKLVARDAQRQTSIENELTQADRAGAHARAVLAEPAIVAAAEQPPADVAELEQRFAAAQQALTAAASRHSAAQTRVNELEQLSAQLWGELERVAPARREFSELAGLAEVVAGRGENNRRMSLRSYVLAARLEEVAVAGSLRLRRMSGGRYEFVHSDKAGKHGRRGGLGIDVRDDYTGAVRSAKTLSGGETFMASLALALGLADVVAAESGGLRLDTLFIDEGFGSLDADTLDAVMGVLDELREGGRVVGVVSHVDEMRQRIPTRLHVIRGRDGSQVKTVVG